MHNTENKDDGWPKEIVLFRPLEVLERAAKFVGDILLHRHSETPQRGAEAFLSAHIEPLDGEAIEVRHEVVS